MRKIRNLNHKFSEESNHSTFIWAMESRLEQGESVKSIQQTGKTSQRKKTTYHSEKDKHHENPIVGGDEGGDSKENLNLTSASYDDLNNRFSKISKMESMPEPENFSNAQKKSTGSSNIIPDVDSNAATAEQLEIERAKCQHEICLPGGVDNSESSSLPLFQARSTAPAKKFSFTLDPFQSVSIVCLERHESVLVSAHTSAGKTVVAQYAIAMALRDKQRVIYTSPIKALSNQKYRDLAQEFGDVGLMTGDTTISTDASCLVMTTEILRSMLYRGSELIKEVSWVIYDEVHYMRDKERGVVWEETLILLPDTVHFVFLSATIPNARQFASWIARLHNQPCHVVYTEYRPIPLQHYFFPAGSQALHLVVDETSRFRDSGFDAAMSAVSAREESKRRTMQLRDTARIVSMIIEKQYEPVIVFAFSRKSCEAFASRITRDFNTAEEHKTVALIFDNAIHTLSEQDRRLPQVSRILPLLQRGIGVHHSGLLPLLKEVIEILFQEGLIKVLFATETFSIGLNMPAKTVVFTALRKFDGDSFRWLSGGEYIQMSGRAGRRGIDKRGIVVVMLDEKMDPSVARQMVRGQADMLSSSFYIKYNMLLSTLRVENLNPEKMLRQSFRQFQFDEERPKLEEQLSSIDLELSQMPSSEDDVEYDEYFELKTRVKSLKSKIRNIAMQPVYVLPFLVPGRLIKILQTGVKWDWGVLVNYQVQKDDASSRNIESRDSSKYILDVLLYCELNSRDDPRPAKLGTPGELIVVPVVFGLIKHVSQLRLKLSRDLRSDADRFVVYRSLMETCLRFENNRLPLLDVVNHLGVKDPDVLQLVENLRVSTLKLQNNRLFSQRDIETNPKYQLNERKTDLRRQAQDLQNQLSTHESIILSAELKCMKNVLRELCYINSENFVEVKGQVACEINAADELVLTELIFSGFFNNLSEANVAAMLSCFVFQEKSEDPQLTDELSELYEQLCSVVRKVGTVEKDCNLPTDPEEYVSKFQPALVRVFHEWAKGSPFLQVCKLTTVFEGSIVRALRRLDELLRQLVVAAKSIGNMELEEKFTKTGDVIRRDVAFTASLYL